MKLAAFPFHSRQNDVTTPLGVELVFLPGPPAPKIPKSSLALLNQFDVTSGEPRNVSAEKKWPVLLAVKLKLLLAC
jgi:hypothetical protein